MWGWDSSGTGAVWGWDSSGTGPVGEWDSGGTGLGVRRICGHNIRNNRAKHAQGIIWE